MKLCLGPPPAATDFAPEDEGWTTLREPSPGWVNLLAAPCGVLAVVVLALAWGRAPSWSGSGELSFLGKLAPLVWLALLFGGSFVGTVIAHERLHAVAYPRFGLTNSTIVGAWPSRLLFYAGYLGELGRSRWLLVYVFPLLVLSVLPMLTWRLCGLYSGVLHFVSLLNGLASGGDLLMVLLILVQVPHHAKLRNRGWCTWWKIEEGPRDCRSARAEQVATGLASLLLGGLLAVMALSLAAAALSVLRERSLWRREIAFLLTGRPELIGSHLARGHGPHPELIQQLEPLVPPPPDAGDAGSESPGPV
jgi:hypothetical protein